MTFKEKITRCRIRTPTRKDLHVCSPVIYHCATLAWVWKVSILVYKSSTLQNNTFFEMSVFGKSNTILEFFQSAYVILLIKQHTCKVSTLRLHIQKTIELFRFFTSSSTSPFYQRCKQETTRSTVKYFIVPASSLSG